MCEMLVKEVKTPSERYLNNVLWIAVLLFSWHAAIPAMQMSMNRSLFMVYIAWYILLGANVIKILSL